MQGAAVKDEAELAEEARLARATAAGDGSAFAALYERYEGCAFNFAYRVTGSQADATDAVPQAFLAVTRRLPRLRNQELAFGTHLFSAIRDACHEQMHGRHGAPPREKIRQEEEIREEDGIREASMRLPERQREVLALRELVRLSYDEMATVMEASRDSVAQLISRARINLHDELRGNLLASVAAPSPECERALPLIATRDDGQLQVASPDADWLDAHVDSCGRCRLGIEAMREAATSYGAWAPIAATPWLLKETMAKAAEMTGADWTEEIAQAAARDMAQAPATLSVDPGIAGPRRAPRRRMTLAAGLAGMLLLTGLAAAVFAGDDAPPTRVDAAADSAPEAGSTTSKSRAKAAKAGWARAGGPKGKSKAHDAATETTAAETTTAGEPTPAPTPIPSQTTSGGGPPSDPAPRPNRPAGRTAVQPTKQTSTSKPSPKPQPTAMPTAAPQPAPTPTPAPVTEEPPPTDESPGKSGEHADPPGKPADRPAK